MKISPAAESTAEPPSGPVSVDDYLDIDSRLTRDELDARELVRTFGDKRLRDVVPDWYEHGLSEQDARDVLREFGKLGLLGMYLHGYGCAGAGVVSYGLACTELEAVDSGLRSMVSVQGSLSMSAIHRFGSDEQKQTWLPRLATAEALCCFGLTEPDTGSDPGTMRTVARRNGSDWVLNGTKMWITNGAIADIAIVWAQTEDGVRGFLVPTDTPGFTATHMRRQALDACVDHLRADPRRRPDPGRGPVAWCRGFARTSVLLG